MRVIAVGKMRTGPEAVLLAQYSMRLRPPLTVTEVFIDALVLEIESQANWPKHAPKHITTALTWVDDFWQVAHLLKAVFLADNVVELVGDCFGGRSMRQMLLNIAAKTCDVLCSSGCVIFVQ